MTGVRLHYSGRVQGVGFRPAAWRVARELGLPGRVYNNRSGAVVELWAEASEVRKFRAALEENLPGVACVTAVREEPLSAPPPSGFSIAESDDRGALFNVLPDLATCPECQAEVLDPFARRYRYPLTNCTQCGPRFSIMSGAPYDRPRTSMSPFPMCPECKGEYDDPTDRRFHAQPIACHRCGPKVRLERLDGHAYSLEALTQLDEVDAIAALVQRGSIVAIQGIGGFHLACDATQEAVVRKLREVKHRFEKPFALMARDLEMIRKYCVVTEAEQVWLQSPEAPIVLLQQHEENPLPESLAPGQVRLGFLLPYAPIHHLMFRRIRRPLVMTSANQSEEPQCISLEEVRGRLEGIAEWVVWHERAICNRMDDSVLQVSEASVQVFRRARGFAPSPLKLPPGFEDASGILSCGAELKNTFCLVQEGSAVLSQHIGDLKEGRADAEYRRQMLQLLEFYQLTPEAVVVDLHPDYRSTVWGQELARQRGWELLEVQHHHAHIAACLGEHEVPLAAPPVLGVALDGLGYGADGSFWGGEFLLADYRGFQRVGTFKPVPMLGGAQAMREPWRNTLAHLLAEMGWSRFEMNYGELELTQFLRQKPITALQSMMSRSPLATSCGRLFDAVAGAVGLCREQVHFEGQAAMRLEAIADESDPLTYPFNLPRLADSKLPYLEPLVMWEALLGDLVTGTPASVISARFHRGLADAMTRMVVRLCRPEAEEVPVADTVVLTGGVFQNTLLTRWVRERLEMMDFRVLTPTRIPANDGGVSLGQALIAAAHRLHSQPLAVPGQLRKVRTCV